jgi:hypothetical protein
VAKIKSYMEFQKDVLKAFTQDFPGERLFGEVFARWLLSVHCELLERYTLYKEFTRNHE